MGLIGSLEYVFEELRENYRSSWWWRKRIAARVLKPIHTNLYPGFDDAVRVMDQDWDVLVVLDACRVDLFEEVADRAAFDDYERVSSLGSATAEWTERNFADGSFGDTVYVASNPHTSRLAGDSFHDIVEVWREHFDDEDRTVQPDPVVEAARLAREEYPDKRLIVHFMQPHRPFVRADSLQFEGWHPKWHYDTKDVEGIRHPFHALEAGVTTREAVWEAYADNLEYVLADAIELARELDGRAILTSDHGNLLGEWGWPVPVKQYAHPVGVRLQGLVTVPWAVIESDERPTIREDGVTAVDSAEEAEIEDRLRALGYRE